MYEHILVTGGAGFVGSAIAITLQRTFPDTRVVALDNLRRAGSELNLPRLQEAGVRFTHGDVRCPEDLAALAHPPGLIVECSAEPSALAGYHGSPEYLIGANLIGCHHCLELARRSGAGFLFLSTSRVYPYGALNRIAYHEAPARFELSAAQPLAGASAAGVSEQFPLAGARSLYGMTKLAAELMIEEYGDAYGVPYIINRCGLIAGPGQMGRAEQGVITHWVATHYFGGELRYIGYGGTGKQVRDVLHIDDLRDLVASQVREFARYSGCVLNAGGGRFSSLSLLEATELCREITGRRVPVTASTEERRADVRIYISDHQRVSGMTGWRPRRDPRTTLSDIFDWLHREEGALKRFMATGGQP